MLYIFNISESNNEYYLNNAKKYINIELSKEIGRLEKINNNKLNIIDLVRAYFIDFSDL